MKVTDSYIATLEMSYCLSTLVEDTVLFCMILNDLGAVVENQLAIEMGVYFSTLNSVPLVYRSVLLPLLQGLHCRSVVVNFETGKCECSNFVLLFQRFFLFLFFFFSYFSSLEF